MDINVLSIVVRLKRLIAEDQHQYPDIPYDENDDHGRDDDPEKCNSYDDNDGDHERPAGLLHRPNLLNARPADDGVPPGVPHLEGDGVSAAVSAPVQAMLQPGSQHEVLPDPGPGLWTDHHLLQAPGGVGEGEGGGPGGELAGERGEEVVLAGL